MMSLLTELDSFTLPFLQICQSYGLRRLRVLARQKIQMPNAPNVQRKMILARRSSHRANRKSARSAPVPGRSNVANQAAIETSKAHRRPSLAAAGDGRAPPAFRGSSGRESAPSKHRPQNNEPIHIGCYEITGRSRGDETHFKPGFNSSIRDSSRRLLRILARRSSQRANRK
jgi:hypothetical protein